MGILGTVKVCVLGGDNVVCGWGGQRGLHFQHV